MHLWIVSRVYRPEPGAAAVFLGAVADSTIETGGQVTVIGAKPTPEVAQKYRKIPGEKLVLASVLRNAQGYIRGYLQYLSFDLPLLWRLAVHPKPDIIFVEAPPTTGAVVSIISKLRKIPYVYRAADVWSEAAKHATNSKIVLCLLKYVEKFALRNATELIAMYPSVAKQVRALGVKTKTTIAGVGAETNIFNYRSVPQRKEFIYPGSYTELHGASVLIDAFKIFSDKNPGYKLRFIGTSTPDVKAEMQHKVNQYGISSQITFEPAVIPDQLAGELNSAVATLATLNPYGQYSFAFATKIYSSLASGCPTLFAGPGPTAKFIANNPDSQSVVAQYDAQQIAAAMQKIARNPLTAAQRQELAEWTAQNYSLKSAADITVARLTAAAHNAR
ncbi:glycosyltransferase [Canibacter sp. lx-45]|uniref:glycosyltransferase n=1 Tax=Canibacter zhuwentaonis TaxID=2837491 RepID=UPI001BDC7EDB|nr:glycosyltransferase [Canibacter zhuwentaonis]MBT1035420.1 glycosyltransferase [Canibacter zhuwentaonis]